MMKKIKLILILISFHILFVNCDPLPEEEQIRFFLNNQWRLIDIRNNGVSETNVDITRYRLTLNEDQSLELIDFDGTIRMGTWALINGDRELVLFDGEDNQQRYLIIDLQIRRMELQTLLVSNKTGATEFRFLFEPVP